MQLEDSLGNVFRDILYENIIFFLLVLSYHRLRTPREQIFLLAFNALGNISMCRRVSCLGIFLLCISVVFLLIVFSSSLLKSKTSLILKTFPRKSCFLKCLPGSQFSSQVFSVFFTSVLLFFNMQSCSIQRCH